MCRPQTSAAPVVSASLKLTANIEVLTRSEVTALEGCDGNLETARWRHCGHVNALACSRPIAN
jgi:hypothetical protein